VKKKAKRCTRLDSPGKTVIGLTGAIASGKSLALEYFTQAGAEGISADVIAAQVLTAPACYNRILTRFGRKTILTNGFLDKERLAAEVFSAPAKRKWLESLLHPEIIKRIHSLIKKSRKKIVVVEAPLLFEAGLAGCFTFTVCVVSPARAMLARARARGWTAAQYRVRAAAQLGPREKSSRSDMTLYNGGAPGELKAGIADLCRFLEAAGEK